MKIERVVGERTSPWRAQLVAGNHDVNVLFNRMQDDMLLVYKDVQYKCIVQFACYIIAQKPIEKEITIHPVKRLL